ncbi:hypothetical protein GS940_22065 [Rhodococcus hoagii]|nr:hypothetical protein [Prescottella equi]
MDTDLIEQTVVVTATIAQEADGHTNTVDLEAHLDGDGCVLPRLGAESRCRTGRPGGVEH